MKNRRKRTILSLITCMTTLLLITVIVILSYKYELISLIAKMIIAAVTGLQVGNWSATINKWLEKKLNLLED